MIYEFRTYTLKVGSMGKFEDNFAKALPIREKHSKLTACWHTEIGPLNQIIHVWAYEDMKHRAEVRAAAAAEPGWPPPGDGEDILKMENGDSHPRAIPGCYRVGSSRQLLRDALLRQPSRLHPEDNGTLGGETSEKSQTLPSLLLWVHRHGVTEQADPHLGLRGPETTQRNKGPQRRRREDWPPATREYLVTMNNKIMVPSSFSPVH